MEGKTPKSERVVVVRTDPNGNVLSYDVVDRPTGQEYFDDSRPVYRSPTKNNASYSAYDDGEERRTERRKNRTPYKPESAPVGQVPVRRKTPSRGKRGPRRVRYVPKKPNVRIFDEIIDWNAEAKVDTRNDEAIDRIRSAPKKKIEVQKLSWNAEPKIDARNENYVEHNTRTLKKTIFDQQPVWNAEPKIDTHNEQVVNEILRAPKTPIFKEKRKWKAEPKIDTHNEKAIEEIRRAPKHKIVEKKHQWRAQPKIDSHNEEIVANLERAPKPQIYDEKLQWQGRSKIDSHNEEAIERLKSAPKTVIYDEKFYWPSVPRIDNQNEEYIRHKERERINQEEKLFRNSIPSTKKITVEHGRIDHVNPEFDEHRRRKKSAGLPPIENRKLAWKKRARVNQQNDDYIERIGQKRSMPLIFREKVSWLTKTPRIDARNKEFEEKIKEPSKVKISTQKLNWKAEPKIASHNDSYDPNAHAPSEVFNEKVQWYARPKIDTGLEPEDSEDEYYDEDIDY